MAKHKHNAYEAKIEDISKKYFDTEAPLESAVATDEEPVLTPNVEIPTEDITVDDIPEVIEEVVDPKVTEPIVEPVVDKYEESKKKDVEESFDIVKDILMNQSLSVDEKLNRISNEAHVSYKSIIEIFGEFDSAIRGELLSSVLNNPALYGRKIKALYDTFRKVLSNDDVYVSMLQIRVLMLLYLKYRDTSMVITSIFAYGEHFEGSKEEYQDFCYIMSTLGMFQEAIDNGTVANIAKSINFNTEGFLHGKRLQEFYLNVLM